MEKVFNIGTGACAAAILIFAFHIRVPEVMGTFVDSVGNAAVPLSMMTVGIMVAQSDLRELVTDKKAAGAFRHTSAGNTRHLYTAYEAASRGPGILRHLHPSHGHAGGQCGDDGGKEYGTTDGSISAKSIALTSVLSVVTIPLVTYLA